MLAPYVSGGPDSDPMTRGLAELADVRRDLTASTNRADLTKAGKWRDEDESRYTEQRNSDRLEEAQIEHDRLYAQFSALPESVAGSPGSGVAAGIIPTAAMAARFTPNPLFGSFGPGTTGPALPTGATGAGLYPIPGGAAGGFNLASGVSGTEAKLDRIAGLLEQINRKASAGGLSAPMNVLGAMQSAQNQTYNPARPPR